MEYRHTPVMLSEAMEYLNPNQGGVFVDCTLGGGGYTKALLDAVGESGRVISLDVDELAINNASNKLKNYKNLIIVHDNFKNLQTIVDKFLGNKKATMVDGIVFDLGLSSAQLEDGSRGLSFRVDAPLNMSFGGAQGSLNTFNIVNKTKEQELARMIWEYGEERYANRIARKIVEVRKVKPIDTTGKLVEVIGASVPANYRHNKIHYATRTFQALRIITNQEIDSLIKVLPQTISLLKPGGRLVVISYHSLEDRIVKKILRQESKNCLCPPQAPICSCQHQANFKIVTKKPLTPTATEINNNPRARSAKMRVAEKI
jgi:16S rRNA (cytosine1402-N4)-methyltransferase